MCTFCVHKLVCTILYCGTHASPHSAQRVHPTSHLHCDDTWRWTNAAPTPHTYSWCGRNHKRCAAQMNYTLAAGISSASDTISICNRIVHFLDGESKPWFFFLFEFLVQLPYSVIRALCGIVASATSSRTQSPEQKLPEHIGRSSAGTPSPRPLQLCTYTVATWPPSSITIDYQVPSNYN